MNKVNQLAFNKVPSEQLHEVVEQITDSIAKDNAKIVDSKTREVKTGPAQARVYNLIVNSHEPKVNIHLDNDRVITVIVNSQNQISWSIQ